MSEKKVMVAFDCGNTSFRTVVGEYEDGIIRTKVINQSPNYMVKIGDYFYWDILYIFNEFKSSLRMAVSRYGKIDSVGVATWGVDFAFFDKNGYMLSNPLSYRNVIGEEILSEISEAEQKKLFEQSGILCDKINSAYMMVGIKKRMPYMLKDAFHCLMIPDILNYFLTGKMINEPSELSTTQLMSAKTRMINSDICSYFGIDSSLFGPIGHHGEVIGTLQKEIAHEIGATNEIPVICVPSHDTASAVAAIPAFEEHFAFISCGTWSLIGTELREPLINDAVRKASLTNEIGASGRITLLKNSAGLFIVNRLKKEYELMIGKEISWNELSTMAKNSCSNAVIDLNDSVFFNPENMSRVMWEYLLISGQVEGELDWGVLFMAFYRSLACSFADTINNIEKVVGYKLGRLYIVGGGSMSRLLVEMTAEYTGKTVVICYGESTSMGNLMTQLNSFMPEKNMDDMRRIVAASYKTETVKKECESKEPFKRYRTLVNINN